MEVMQGGDGTQDWCDGISAMMAAGDD